MMLYIDSSALVKCYAQEPGALDTIDLLDGADMVASSPITRVEVSSALARAVREGLLSPKAGREAYAAFCDEWRSMIQVPVAERVLVRAQELLWANGLRAYDALQLASALVWQERLAADVTIATFDRRLAAAAGTAGVRAWPGER
jgi:predicted nucleic acid-binding protein